jgi:hypothetical protein
MQNRTTQVTVRVSDSEKATIRQAAAAAGVSMSTYIRNRALDGLPFDEPTEETVGSDLSPLEDFATAHITVDEEEGDAVPKRHAYNEYVTFCEVNYPDHDIETQHKFSREIGSLDGVETGREYVSDPAATTPTLSQLRCFKNIRLRPV